MLKRNELSSHEKTWRKLKCILLSKRTPSENITYCRNPTLMFWKRHNYGNSKKIGTVQTKGFYGSEAIRRVAMIAGISNEISSIPKSEPPPNCGLGVVVC